MDADPGCQRQLFSLSVSGQRARLTSFTTIALTVPTSGTLRYLILHKSNKQVNRSLFCAWPSYHSGKLVILELERLGIKLQFCHQ